MLIRGVRSSCDTIPSACAMPASYSRATIRRPTLVRATITIVKT
jgi:hypothetical protein